MSSAANLEDHRVPHLRAGRLVLRAFPREALDSELLEAVEAAAGVAYRSIHGEEVAAPEGVYRVLDTVLEKCLPAAFAPVPARRHWEGDDGDDALPAGPGPFGSGLRALGSRGERLALAEAERAGSGSDEADDVADDEGDENEDEGDEDEDPREPWREITGDDGRLRDWLLANLPADSLNDCDFPWPSDDRPGHDRAVSEFRAARAELADRVLAAFPADRTRYFLGGHAGWDRYGEDYLSRDVVSGFVTDDQVLVIWTYSYRRYG